MSQKMKWLNRLGRGLFAVSLLLMFSGCFWQVLSWSPDGRWVAFILDAKEKTNGKDKVTYRCDTRTGETKEMPLENREGWFGKTETFPGNPVSCRYLPKGNSLLTVVEYKPQDNDEERWLLYQSKPGGKKCELLASETATVLDVSPDGRRVYYATMSKEQDGDTKREIGRLWEKSFNGPRRLLLQCDEKKDETFPWFGQLSPSGKQFVYATGPKAGDGLSVLDLDKLTTRSIITAAADKDSVLWPMWLDEENMLFLSGDSDDYATLHRIALRTGEQRVVSEKEIYAMQPLSLSPDKKTVAVAMREKKDNKKNLLALVNVDSGKVEFPKQLPYTVAHPAFSPDGKRLAFLSAAQENGRLEILDLATKRSVRSWTDTIEKEFVTAESQMDAGKKSEALSTFTKFVQKHADSPCVDLARYYVVRLSAEIAGSDAMLANEALNAIQDNDLKAEAAKLTKPLPTGH